MFVEALAAALLLFEGRDGWTLAGLVRTNWIRTIGWSLRGLPAFYLLRTTA